LDLICIHPGAGKGATDMAGVSPPANFAMPLGVANERYAVVFHG
jgi:hypothetical protein